MTKKDIKINTRLMDEFNLETGDRGIICDRETGEAVAIRGKRFYAPGAESDIKHTSEFDPINSIRQMNTLFGRYVETMEKQGQLDGSIISFGIVPSQQPNMVRASIKINSYDGDGIEEIKSAAYHNETSAYADLLCRLNESEDTDMSKFDIDRKKQAEKQRRAAAKAQKFKTSGGKVNG